MKHDPNQAAGEGSPSRRAVLAGAMGGLAVLAAESLAQIAPAVADNGGSVKLGQDNTETLECKITNTAAGGSALHGVSSGTGLVGEVDATGAADSNAVAGVNQGAGQGVRGDAIGAGIGVYGVGSSGPGVRGDSTTGVAVAGFNLASNNIGVQGAGEPGVRGDSSAGNGIGVAGVSPSGTGVRGDTVSGYGVIGTATGGVGVRADHQNGETALLVTGRASFSRSGAATVKAGTSSKKITGVSLSASSMILATIQQNRAGLFVQAAVPDPASSSFTIYLNQNASQSTKVAWFVLN